MEILKKYFPGLTEVQLKRFEKLGILYPEWNRKINVISRKDIDQLFLHHILHSLAVAKYVQFKPGARVLDLGTGGGLPGIPLAILFPETQFTLIDARAKKLVVVKDLIDQLGLTNAGCRHQRAEEMKEKFDFVLARAVTKLEILYTWAMPRISTQQKHALPNGLIVFKGGNIRDEINALPKKAYVEVIPVHDFFPEPYFSEKYLVYVQR